VWTSAVSMIFVPSPLTGTNVPSPPSAHSENPAPAAFSTRNSMRIVCPACKTGPIGVNVIRGVAPELWHPEQLCDEMPACFADAVVESPPSNNRVARKPNGTVRDCRGDNNLNISASVCRLARRDDEGLTVCGSGREICLATWGLRT